MSTNIPFAGDVIETPGNATSTLPSWDEIVRRHTAAIDRHAYRLTRNRADAEDLRQDVLLRVAQSMAAGAPRNPDAWLYRVTLNLFLDRTRRTQRIRISALHDGAADQLVETSPNPADILGQAFFDFDIRVALDKLAPACREAVLLRDIEGLTYDEIATFTGVARGTVASRIHRGHRQLRAELSHRAPRLTPNREPNKPPGAAVDGGDPS